MKSTQKLHDLGQSLWLDNITRELLNSGTLKRYIDELSVTGLTSNPTIFDNAIKNSAIYDGDIASGASAAKSGEDLFFGLALADLTRAADLFQSVFARTDGVDGWVSLEVSPVLAHDSASTLADNKTSDATTIAFRMTAVYRPALSQPRLSFSILTSRSDVSRSRSRRYISVSVSRSAGSNVARIFDWYKTSCSAILES
jgi:hypothetical protein